MTLKKNGRYFFQPKKKKNLLRSIWLEGWKSEDRKSWEDGKVGK